MRYRLVAGLLVSLMVSASAHVEGQAVAAGVRGWVVDDQRLGDSVTFGFVRSVATDSRGRAYVLDDGLHELLAFENSGRLLGRASRAGFGPGEFTSPSVVLVDRRDRILVLDSRQGRISEFGWQGDRLVHVRDHRLSGQARHACTRGDSLFTLGSGNSELVTLYVRQADDMYVKSRGFGALESRHQHFTHPIVRSLRSSALLACGDQSPLLVAIAQQMGEYQRFTDLLGHGTLFSVEDFTGVEMIVTETSVENKLPKNGVADMTEAAVIGANGGLILSIGEIIGGKGNRNVFRGYRIIELDSQARVTSRVRSEWILGHARGTAVACYRNDPAPAVKVVFGVTVSGSACGTSIGK